MASTAAKSLPAIDYVSIVRSVYKDRRGMLIGAISAGVTAAAAGFSADSRIIFVHAAALIVIGMLRFFDARQFEAAALADDDAEGASEWEFRATITGCLAAFVYGSWCFSSLIYANDAFAVLASIALSVAALVGVCTRNFGLDRLVTLQIVFVGVPLGAGLFIAGGIYHAILAMMIITLMISFRKLAGDVRAILLAAVHGREQASSLAQQLDTALDTMQHGLCMLDGKGIIRVVNDRALLAFQSFAPGEWRDQPLSALIAAADEVGFLPRTASERLIDMVTEQGSGKVLLSLPDAVHFEVTVSSRGDRTVLLFEDISERMRAEERINFMARYDALTGLPNRAYFTDMVGTELEDRRTFARGDHAAVMIIDIDDFKHVNDTMGHLVGDKLLAETSVRLRQSLPTRALLARLGGDEFIVYIAGCDTAEALLGHAGTILEAFISPFNIGGEQLVTNISVGVVEATNPADDLDALMVKADLALYQAKGNGKGQVELFQDAMDTDYRYRQKLKSELRLALETGGLTLNYQPIIDIVTRQVVGCEALARWHHPQLGSIPPSLFIPIAEETGMISEITRWVLETATVQCMTWPGDISVAVNISARDFRSGDIAGMVDSALRHSGLPPQRLEVEVTETAVIEERDAASKILNALAEQGISIALDDFGTGYSSLSYLQALPFSKLKIDRSFVADLGSPRALKLIANVARLGKDINLIVTAEGVETEAQLQLIATHTKVDQIQGYLFGVPLPARDIAELITRMAVSGDPAEKRRHG